MSRASLGDSRCRGRGGSIGGAGTGKRRGEHEVTGRQGHERIRTVAVAGASGYTGVELLRLLLQHPWAKVVALTADTYANQPIGKVFPSLTGLVDLTCLPLDTAKLAAEAEFVFLALPHKTSMAAGADLIQRGARVLDLSANYRLKDAAAYPRWYGVQHVVPHLLKEAAYGLPELHRAAIAMIFLLPRQRRRVFVRPLAETAAHSSRE